MKNILVTGAMGFVGLNFIKHCHLIRPEWRIIAVDSITYAANKELAGPYFGTHGVVSYKADINENHSLNKIMWDHNIEVVVNFAAESHVDRSIDDPETTLRSNFNGVANLLEVVRKRETHGFPTRYIQMSTDEVFGDAIYKEQGFVETDPYNPSSPYAASKAAADCLIKSYIRTYGLDCKIVHCTNLYGPLQQVEKFIPKVVGLVSQGKNIPIYGNGHSSRYWLFISDFCEGLIKLIESPEVSRHAHNFSGDGRVLDSELAKLVAEIVLNRDIDLDQLLMSVPGRPGQDMTYWLDDRATRAELDWTPIISLRTGVIETVKWHLAYGSRLSQFKMYKPQWQAA